MFCDETKAKFGGRRSKRLARNTSQWLHVSNCMKNDVLNFDIFVRWETYVSLTTGLQLLFAVGLTQHLSVTLWYSLKLLHRIITRCLWHRYFVCHYFYPLLRHSQLLHDDDDNISVSTAGPDMDQVLTTISGNNVTPRRVIAGSTSDASVVWRIRTWPLTVDLMTRYMCSLQCSVTGWWRYKGYDVIALRFVDAALGRLWRNSHWFVVALFRYAVFAPKQIKFVCLDQHTKA